jgi:asparagine synthetase B (glutamine-hydrolysing)
VCGIAGCCGIRDEATIDRMLDALPHRGPNDRGVHTFGDTVLGHTRLSEEFPQIKAENPKATINSREAAYYFKIF